MTKTIQFLSAILVLAFIVAGCATPQAYDYTAFQKAKPTTLLVLPPEGNSFNIKNRHSVWAQATLPLAEAGYYVLPITLVDETLRQNDLNTFDEIMDVSPQKLREVFGADAAVYLRLTQYGTRISTVSSTTTVTTEETTTVAVDGSIVDLHSGELLWQGKASASHTESHTEEKQEKSGFLESLLTNIVEGILDGILNGGSNADKIAEVEFRCAGLANQLLLGVSRFNGLLPGPRSPLYGQSQVGTDSTAKSRSGLSGILLARRESVCG